MINYNSYSQMSNVALGKEKASLVLKHATVLDVFSEKWVQTDVAIENGVIVGLGSYEGKEELDLQGKYIVPGFVDSHLHLESTLVNPSELIHQALQFGTTTFIVDPHEAGNVAGLEGIQFIIDETSNVEGHVYVMAPSCVPAIDGEETGCILEAPKLSELKQNPRILGLGEVMDIPRVINGNVPMLKKLELYEDRVIDGHIIVVSDKELQAFVLAGVRTNHEAGSYEEAKAQVMAGVQVLIREGSAAHNLEAIVTGMIEDGVCCDKYSFCTDDKHIEDIIAKGHISYNVKRSIELGLDPIQTYKIASYNSCVAYHLRDQGAIAPGYKADLIILDDYKTVTIHDVLVGGKKISRTYTHDKKTPTHLLHTVNIGEFKPSQLDLPVTGPMPIINLIPGTLLTKMTHEEVPVSNGLFMENGTFNKITCIERHHATGHNGVGIIKGYDIKNGAIGTSVAHDAHNVIVVGDNDRDMLVVIERLKEIGGGYVIASEGNVVAELPLEIMGLITNQSHEVVDAKVAEMKEIAYSMGVNRGLDPFINLSFLCLTVIPEIKITTKGIAIFGE